MKLATIFAALLLAGCSTLTPQQKQYVQIGVAVLVVGAIAAHESDSGGNTASTHGPGLPTNPCRIDPSRCF